MSFDIVFSYVRMESVNAAMVELADTSDLGSDGLSVQVQVLLAARNSPHAKKAGNIEFIGFFRIFHSVPSGYYTGYIQIPHRQSVYFFSFSVSSFSSMTSITR